MIDMERQQLISEYVRDLSVGAGDDSDWDTVKLGKLEERLQKVPGMRLITMSHEEIRFAKNVHAGCLMDMAHP